MFFNHPPSSFAGRIIGLNELRPTLSDIGKAMHRKAGAAPLVVYETVENAAAKAEAGRLDALVRKKMGDLETRNKKHSRLVEELEDQLQTNFNDAKMTTNRLSVMQTEHTVQLEEATAEYRRLRADLLRLAEAPRETAPRELFSLRLDAALLTGRATRIEGKVVGGRGYAMSSPTARRAREAAFLPVQSPTEGHLRWVLQNLA